MTPKEKAIELVGKFCLNNYTDKNIEKCKKDALIAVNEILNSTVKRKDISTCCNQIKTNEYWKEVKKELLTLSNENSFFTKPILLTEELLLKFGFKIPENYFWYKKDNIFSNMLSVGIQNNENGAITIINNIRYLHQLKKIYFTSTNKELIINEKN